MTRQRLTALRYPKAFVDEVAKLVELHLRFHGFGRGEWTDAAVRRYATDAGPLLDRLHVLVRSDCTTRNKRKAAVAGALLRPPRGAHRGASRSRRSSTASGPISTATRS